MQPCEKIRAIASGQTQSRLGERGRTREKTNIGVVARRNGGKEEKINQRKRDLPWCIVHQCQLSKETFINILENLEKNNIKMNISMPLMKKGSTCRKTQTSLVSMPF